MAGLESSIDEKSFKDSIQSLGLEKLMDIINKMKNEEGAMLEVFSTCCDLKFIGYRKTVVSSRNQGLGINNFLKKVWRGISSRL